MQFPGHDISSARSSGSTRRRAVAIGGVGLLHVAAISALISGMTGELVKYVPGPIQVRFFDPVVPPKPLVAPPKPRLTLPSQPSLPIARVPVVKIVDTRTPVITMLPPQPHTPPPVSDSGATGIGVTHTTPPYPMQARLLSHQGTVTLEMTISAQGDVVAVAVIQSSGYSDLDAAAVSWVTSHWKYRPAIVGGAAVSSRTRAAVKFDLKRERG